MAQHIAQKLRLTAALLGTVSRKDLAAAFRGVNPKTAFDLGRADKWLQGRAQPRQLSVYDDWSKLLKLEQPGAWIAVDHADGTGLPRPGGPPLHVVADAPELVG